jgi:hypothetical protein
MNEVQRYIGALTNALLKLGATVTWERVSEGDSFRVQAERVTTSGRFVWALEIPVKEIVCHRGGPEDLGDQQARQAVRDGLVPTARAE